MLQIIWVGALVVLVLLLVFVVQQARVVGRSVIADHSRRAGRLLAVGCIGMAMGVGVHFVEKKERTGGKEAFLEAQAHRFDRFIAKPHDLVPDILTGVIFGAGCVGAYELVAWLLYLVVKPAKKEGVP